MPRFGRTDYDAGKAIPKDEPVFLFRAQDKFAADVVRFYANLVKNSGAPTDVVASAMAHADAFDKWSTKKVPDIVKVPPTPVPDALK